MPSRINNLKFIKPYISYGFYTKRIEEHLQEHASLTCIAQTFAPAEGHISRKPRSQKTLSSKPFQADCEKRLKNGRNRFIL